MLKIWDSRDNTDDPHRYPVNQELSELHYFTR